MKNYRKQYRKRNEHSLNGLAVEDHIENKKNRAIVKTIKTQKERVGKDLLRSEHDAMGTQRYSFKVFKNLKAT
jgi:hypothetical protein